MTHPFSDQTCANDEEPPKSGAEDLSNNEHLSDLEIATIIDAGVDSPLSIDQICHGVRLAAESRGFSTGSIGVRITNDATIRELNAKHLGHDYSTDVISFGYTADPPTIEGELVVSVDTAIREAKVAREVQPANWPAKHELMLYIVHGILHITGMDDRDPADRGEMRTAERGVFLTLGIDEINRCGADTHAVADTNENDQKEGTQL